MSIDDAMERLPALKKFKSGVPASDADLARVEVLLGIPLPTDYRTLIRRYGFARWFGHAIFGIHNNAAEKAAGFDFDVVSQTRRARREQGILGGVPLPEDAVVIEHYAAGGWYILFGATSSNAGQIALYDHETGGVTERWNSLADFLSWLGV